ncbi:dTDP-4-dehydrorhamnose reductase [Halothiobacillus neapolitanus]|uniref:dTDP-4-dehydrorhamnose reductase n=1 Tax=Halothiobacillus neapolitanus (strain ATCC 23641 / DSM 15147 / CIP 104769 / NCIMB 8539 / c2) TaxID=555778 RepID=D0L0U7_HALNC|nr:dTDP-4-dehydrorhamnose reductase [Halothiobacillus neapolitanus]ACX96320.1 dTDP-4-dehydrorhamnose reductase [Halothiobacillus neapolitanus c2]TDN66632.1 dTDP-4-dehydrorhamnose reductase [Halothiobacillus neapolitanus]
MNTQPFTCLILGDQGQVAYELKRELATLGRVIAASRSTLPVAIDLAQHNDFESLIRQTKPNCIVNAAAYTAVDKAEQEPELAMRINAEAVAELAQAAAKANIPLIHYSTDYVFDGTAQQPYQEDQPTNPQGVYGQSKLAGEQAIAASGANHLILRTSWVYGTRGGNFLRTMRRLAREREELSVVADQTGCPTWSRHIAQATAQILIQLKRDPSLITEHSGIYHLVSSGQGSWHDFATAIIEHQRQQETIACQRIVPITTAQFPTPAKRPAYSVLNTDKLAETFGVRLPDWREALSQVNAELDQPHI